MINEKEYLEALGLEPHQIAELYQESDVPLVDVRQSVLRRFLYFVVAFVIAIIALGFIVQLPSTIKAPMSIHIGQAEAIYKYPHTIHVLERYVAEGQAVQTGDSLLKITSPEIVELATTYYNDRNELDGQLEFGTASTEQESKAITRQMREYKISNNQAQEALQLAEEKWKTTYDKLSYNQQLDQERYQTQKQLSTQGAVANYTLKEYEQKLADSRHALQAAEQNYKEEKLRLETTVQQSAARIRQLRHQRKGLAIGLDSRTSQAEQQVGLTQQKLEDTYGPHILSGSHLIIQAQQPGKVSYAHQTTKEVPAQNTVLKTIQRPQQHYAIAEIQPKDAGHIQPGTSVALQLTPFPHYEWGSLSGQVIQFSLSPNPNGNYQAYIDVHHYGRLGQHLQPGMPGMASILTEERTIFGYLTKHLKKKYHQLTD